MLRKVRTGHCFYYIFNSLPCREETYKQSFVSTASLLGSIYFPAALFHSAIFALLSALSLLDKLFSTSFLGDRERERERFLRSLDRPLSLDRDREPLLELLLSLSLERERERERRLRANEHAQTKRKEDGMNGKIIVHLQHQGEAKGCASASATKCVSICELVS